jgi:uncharacterized protein (DUF58 family)
MAPHNQYLDPRILNKVARLEFRARRIVEGFISGMHRSPYRGYSVEFAEYRQYAPGDDVKHIDWKAWGRADRYFVKLYEEETNLSCNILLDCSKSMVYGEGQEGMSKFDYGATVAASLAFLLQHQQDAVGAVLFDNDIRTVIPPRASARQAYALVHALEQCRPDHRSDVDTVFTRLPAQIRRRGVVVIISDLFLDLTRLETMLQQFGHQRQDVILFHLLHEDEVRFQFPGQTQFRGLETPDEILVDAPGLRRAYLAALDDFLRQVRQICSRCRADHVFLHTGMPVDVALSAYLAGRQSVRRGAWRGGSNPISQEAKS